MKRLPATHVRSIEHDVLSRNGDDVLTMIIVEYSRMMMYIQYLSNSMM